MKLLTFDKILQAKINPLSCYDWVEEVLKRKDESILPAKISLKPNIAEVFYNVMPSILLWKNWAGVKLVTRYPQRKPVLDSQILLYDLTTGKNLALVDGNWITSMRTGAVAAHSVKLLAVNHFSTIGIIGLGNTARAFLLVLLSLYPNKPLTVKIKKYKDQHDLFIKRFSEFHNIEFICCETLRETVDRVCEKHNILYWLDSGSMLGAVRHNGFIPWDDDLDIKMYRDDYEKFLAVAPQELKKQYFLQTHQTDSEYPLFFAKVRKNNTFIDEKRYRRLNIHKGIYVDIFPVDKLGSNIKVAKKHCRKLRGFYFFLFTA